MLVNLCSKYPFCFFLLSVGAQLVDKAGIEWKGDGARKAQQFLLSSMMRFFFYLIWFSRIEKQRKPNPNHFCSGNKNTDKNENCSFVKSDAKDCGCLWKSLLIKFWGLTWVQKHFTTEAGRCNERLVCICLCAFEHCCYLEVTVGNILWLYNVFWQTRKREMCLIASCQYSVLLDVSYSHLRNLTGLIK